VPAVNLVDLLRHDGSGLPVVDNRVQPAPGVWTPAGVMAHHTAGAHLDVRGLQRGYSFPGPLCNVGIDRDGTRHVITDGRANDSGMGSSVVLSDVRNGRPVTEDARTRGLVDDIDGNPYFYDLEVVNDGVGQPYPPVQLESLAATAAAICRAHDWDEHRVIHHRQWTRRKVDMSWRGDLTGMVARWLNGEDLEVQLAKDIQEALKAAGHYDGDIDGDVGPLTKAALRNGFRAPRMSDTVQDWLSDMVGNLRHRGARPSSLGHILDWYRQVRDQHPNVPKPGP
jgi:hypothetical protein